MEQGKHYEDQNDWKIGIHSQLLTLIDHRILKHEIVNVVGNQLLKILNLETKNISLVLLLKCCKKLIKIDMNKTIQLFDGKIIIDNIIFKMFWNK